MKLPKINRLHVAALFILVGLVGLAPFTGTACGPVYVVDPQTGERRPATPEEIQAIVNQGGDLARVVAVGAGHPEWLPFVDVAVRVIALVAGFALGTKKAAAKVALTAAANTEAPPGKT